MLCDVNCSCASSRTRRKSRRRSCACPERSELDSLPTISSNYTCQVLATALLVKMQGERQVERCAVQRRCLSCRRRAASAAKFVTLQFDGKRACCDVALPWPPTERRAPATRTRTTRRARPPPSIAASRPDSSDDAPGNEARITLSPKNTRTTARPLIAHSGPHQRQMTVRVRP